MPEGERVNIYLPYTLAQAVREARNAGVELNLSSAAGWGIRQNLRGYGATPVNGHQDQAAEVEQLRQLVGHVADKVSSMMEAEHQKVTERLDGLEQLLRLVCAIAFATLVISAMALASVRSLRTA